MITGDRAEGRKYRDLILKQIKESIDIDTEKLQRITQRLNNASSDELERLYQAFNRFGVETIIKNCLEIYNERKKRGII